EKIRELVKESFELAAKVCFGDVLGPPKRLGFRVDGKQLMDVTMGMINFGGRGHAMGEAELINHPDIFNKLGVEIKSVVGSRLVEESDVGNLPYLRARSKFNCEPTMRATANNGSYRDRRSMKHVLDNVHGYIYLETV
ncbi:unnamed protein product, partial [Prunus brigantina]